jgi:hypothetical protein
MPQLLTTNALVQCPHGFPGVSVPENPICSINGGFLLADGDQGTIACLTPVPCVGYTLRSMQLNATVLGEKRTILATDFQQTITGLPLSIQEFHQTFDNSTPAPLPPGQAAPPLSPALLDLAPPVVTAAPAGLAYSTTTPVPSLMTTFTLAAAFPGQWMLTLLSDPTGAHADVTGGASGLAVVPSEDPWRSPLLTVIVTMTTPFLGGLLPGGATKPYHLFMTGVSQRGLTGSFDFKLTVT